MIDRSYLPFPCAREYQDVGMQKWMGFFLSEHTSSLSKQKNKKTFVSKWNNHQKIFLLQQLYANQEPIKISSVSNNRLISWIGQVRSINNEHLILYCDPHYIKLDIETIINIETIKDGDNDESKIKTE